MRLRSSLLPVLLFLVACGDPDEPIASTQEAATICAGAVTLPGADVSHYQGTVDWAKFKASGHVFSDVKATEGTTYIDPKFAENWANMKKAGVVRSAYHFFHADVDPIAQADYFLGVMGPLEPGDLPPTLDLQTADNQTAATITARAIQWLDHVAQKTGTKPFLYANAGFINGTLANPAGLETHAHLWIAGWGVSCPEVPAPFTAWVLWQNSDSGSIAGISNAVDTDVFNGDALALTNLTVNLPPPPPPSSDGGVEGGAGGASGSGGVGGGASSAAGFGGSVDGVGSGIGGGSGAQANPAGCTCSMDRSDGGAMAPLLGGLLALGILIRGRRRRARIVTYPSATIPRPDTH